jgi:putative hemolysin
MPGWSLVDVPMLAVLPVLLLASAFFSGSETALFSLGENERMAFRRGGSRAGRAVAALLADQRMLLITILMGNMTVNTLYFVITSVLLMETSLGVAGQAVLGLAFLVALILLGEVTPKLLANADRTRAAAIIAPPLLAIHRLVGPLRAAVDRLAVAPLSRLTSPAAAPSRLDEQELTALVEISGHHGVIDPDEQRILRDVISLGQLKVRDVMTPRVRLAAVPLAATAPSVRALARETRLTELLVFERDIDHIAGILPVNRYLAEADGDPGALRRLLQPARYVPEIARLDQLLEHFRRTATSLAVAVDEYGGTAGVVAAEDVVEEVVGDIAGEERIGFTPPAQLDRGRWRVDGGTSIRDWAEAIGQRLASPQVSTLGGLIISRLGRAPRAGDIVDLGNLRLEVERVERVRVVSVIVTLVGDAAAHTGGEAPSP